MKFTLKKALEFGWEGLVGKAYNSKEEFSNASAAVFEVTGRHGRVKTGCSDRVYYIVEGKGEFFIENDSFLVEKTDVVIVPKNTAYDYKALGGIMKLFLVYTPAYDPDFDVSLEK